MSATRIFAASTGLRPFSINRISFTLAFTIATLVITKLIDGYIFCGFNLNFFMDLPFGVTLFAGYCVMPLLGLALNRQTKTKAGCCCRWFSIVLIGSWLVGATCFGSYLFFYLCGLVYGDYADHNQIFGHQHPQPPGIDAFNICGNRTLENVRAQFSNAMPTFDVLQRVDLVYKIVNGVAWLLPMAFAGTAFGFFVASLSDVKEDHQPHEHSQVGRSGDDDETCIWAEGEGEPEEFFSAAELETIDECSDQPATIDSDCESPVFGIVDEVSEDVKSNDSGDNDVELQLFKA